MNCILKKLCQHGIIGMCLLGKAIAMEAADIPDYRDTLVIGCRPWDENIQNVPGIRSAHFIDCRSDEKFAEEFSDTFHHLDMTDGKWPGPPAGVFSGFANENPEKFNTIIVDWCTYHHLREDSAWRGCFNLLTPKGMLVVPVLHMTISQQYIDEEGNVRVRDKAVAIPDSDKAAEYFIERSLRVLFRDIKMYTYEEILSIPDIKLDLLRLAPEHKRDPACEPRIIIATK